MSIAYEPDLLLTPQGFVSGQALIAGDNGRIAAIAPADALPELPRVRLRGKAMLPGLVNAHSHTFQRLIRGRVETRGASGDDFWSWREAMYRAANAISPEQVYAVARLAFLEMVLAGTTTVGEFHYVHHAPDGQPYPDPNLLARQVIAAARSVGLRIALLRVAYQRAGYGLPSNPGQRRFYETTDEYLARTEELAHSLGDERAWLGVAPHSIRAVPLAEMERIAAWARERGLPVHLHAAEQRAEFAACVAEYGTTPVELLAQHGLLTKKTTLVHAIHVTEAELDAIAATGATICSCPTTERNLGDGIFHARAAAERGIAIAFGSDSQALIDPLEDAREIEYHSRLQMERRVVLDEIGGRNLSQRLLQYASAGGARALGFDGGVLAEGSPADFFTVDLADPSIAGNNMKTLLAAIVFGLSRTAIRDVAVAGEMILRDGRHPLAGEIVHLYQQVYQMVWRGENL